MVSGEERPGSIEVEPSRSTAGGRFRMEKCSEATFLVTVGDGFVHVDLTPPLLFSSGPQVAAVLHCHVRYGFMTSRVG